MKPVKDTVKMAKVTKEGSPDVFYLMLEHLGTCNLLLKIAPPGSTIKVRIKTVTKCSINGRLHPRDLGKLNEGAIPGDVFYLEPVEMKKGEVDAITGRVYRTRGGEGAKKRNPDAQPNRGLVPGTPAFY